MGAIRMSDEIQNLKYEFAQRDRQEKINTEIYFRLQNLDKLISRIEKLEKIKCENQIWDYNVYTNYFIKIQERLEALETYNKNLSATVHILERDETLVNKILALQERLEKLENFMPDVLTDFEGRIVKLEKRFIY